MARIVPAALIEQGVDSLLEFDGGGLQVGFAAAYGCRDRLTDAQLDWHQPGPALPSAKGPMTVEDGDRQKRCS